MQARSVALRISIIFCLLVISLSYASAKVWATVSFVKTEDSSVALTQNLSKDRSSILTESKPSRSHAPEPTTLALIGGSLLSMIVSFLRKTYLLVKRVVDIIGAVIGLILLSPLLLLTSILIKMTSNGPVLYSQVRVGKNGKHFKIYKFRTMRVDAEQKTGPVWAAKNDNRITPIGSILRKSRIDEIPQFVNVLKGDMSLVGPRPERPIFVEQLKTQICDYEKRLDVKPGITGLAQVWHRYDETLEDVRKKIKYDILYIKKACFWTDILILMRTFRVVLTGSGAR